jgi:hypothetical protein
VTTTDLDDMLPNLPHVWVIVLDPEGNIKRCGLQVMVLVAESMVSIRPPQPKFQVMVLAEESMVSTRTQPTLQVMVWWNNPWSAHPAPNQSFQLEKQVAAVNN